MNAFIDSNGVLVCLSTEAQNGSSTAVPLDDGVVMEAGKWQWVGGAWVAYTSPSELV